MGKITIELTSSDPCPMSVDNEHLGNLGSKVDVLSLEGEKAEKARIVYQRAIIAERPESLSRRAGDLAGGPCKRRVVLWVESSKRAQLDAAIAVKSHLWLLSAPEFETPITYDRSGQKISK